MTTKTPFRQALESLPAETFQQLRKHYMGEKK